MKISANIVLLAKNGDKEAFASLYDSVSADLYRLALYNLGNPHDAEDIVSETFIEAYKGIKGLRDENSFKPWIMKILYTRCKRKITQYIKDRPNSDIDDELDLVDENFSVEDEITEQTTLKSAIDKLAIDERNILLLSSLHGYTTKEISNMMDLPHGTVSSKLHRTYAKMRNMLQKN
ncbi:MAG: sigma-70 family RNA polymerase sigma factor [Oscillospiraceae bacterium]